MEVSQRESGSCRHILFFHNQNPHRAWNFWCSGELVCLKPIVRWTRMPDIVPYSPGYSQTNLDFGSCLIFLHLPLLDFHPSAYVCLRTSPVSNLPSFLSPSFRKSLISSTTSLLWAWTFHLLWKFLLSRNVISWPDGQIQRVQLSPLSP